MAAGERAVRVPFKSDENIASEPAPKAVVAMIDRKSQDRVDPRRDDRAPKLAKNAAAPIAAPATANVAAPNVNTPTTTAGPLEARHSARSANSRPPSDRAPG